MLASRDTGDVSSYNQHYLVSHLDLMGLIGYIPTDGEFGIGSCPGHINRLGYILNCLLMVTFQYSPFIFLVINNYNGSLFMIRILYI